ncbi:major facilitator superfamily domain-containing protein [Mycena belliarum]|uniref:Major facilitator superfamily domain-containing protein n=1 Tax=Mycena belliarum TaxID=1033014 RepID=A0AAD6U1T0_9AGAR|nr:major facilitator superfamily domain-containing protein [Mycena belliae]
MSTTTSPERPQLDHPPSAEDDVQTLASVNAAPASAPKSRAFYLSFVAIMVATFLSALDLTAIGTALPTIANALNDTKGDYTWVGSAYALSSTAFIPLSGNLADTFGRRPIMLISIAFFAVGSALAGASQNMDMMIAARAIQGIGGGGIINLSEILTADLVPLAERGLYQGMLGLVWSFASSIGPPIGGALANEGSKAWRWLFYLNLPLTGIAFFLVWTFLSVRTPEGSIRSKLALVDWTGNAILIVGAGLAIIGMTWGGIRYPWQSAQVLAPLIIGFALMIVFAIYEAKVPERPTIPRDIVSNRTSLSGLLTTAAHGIVSISMIYYLPVFFQACFGASPIRSAVDFLPGALVVAPFALTTGIVVTITKQYRIVNWVGWVISIVGFGLYTLLRQDASVAQWVGFQVVVSIGMGILYAGPVFPLLAPLPNNRTASALALFSFTRSFFQTWGITISGTILQNMLLKKLPADFVAQFPAGFEIAFAAIPAIKLLEEPLRTQVQAAFAESMATIWQTMIGISGLGLLCSFLMAEVPLGTTVDENYALQEKDEKLGDAEKR